MVKKELYDSFVAERKGRSLGINFSKVLQEALVQKLDA
jgi:hypothetical protein